MKLPIPFLQQKKNDSDYYLALILTDDKASAVVLQERQGVLKRLNSHVEHFAISIEDISREEFISIIDKTISRAEEILPPEIETHQTVFGVKNNWVNQDTKKIKKEYLEKLKKVCDALNLTPLGFMVTTEAVIHLLQEDEGAPLSAVFAEIEKSQITLSLYRGGQAVQTVNGPHGDSAPETVDKLLNHFTVPVLPARLVLYSTKPDERTHQAFLNHQWSKSLPFLHMPQITLLPAPFSNRAVMFGAATQMGFHIEQSPDAMVKQEHEAEDYIETDESNMQESLQQMTPSDPQRKDEDEEFSDESEVSPELKSEGGDFGFVIDGEPRHEAVHKQYQSESLMEPEMTTHNFSKQDVTYDETSDAESETNHKNNILDKIPFLAAFPKFSLPKKLPLPKIAFGGGNNTLVKVAVPIVIGVLLIAGIWYYYTNSVHATVLLTVSPKPVTQDESVTFSTTEENDFTNNVISAKTITATVDGEATTDATGKKDVGEKAKGSVTVYNNGSDPVNLGSNTTLKASTGEVFTLDSSVQVPASTGDVFTGTKPGTAQANVTASELGTDGNLPSGTRFSIGINSDLAAKNDNAFSGGTKKNITVVSKDDLAKLRTEILKKFENNGQNALSQKSTNGEIVLPIVGEAELDNEKFDKKEGDETKKVTLHASVSFTGMSYQNDDLKKYAETVLNEKYDQDTSIAKDSIKETVKDITKKNSKSASASITLEAGILPKINTSDVVETVKDKSLSKAKEAIANLPQVSKTDIVFSPPIPLLPSLFPKLPKNITVEIKTQ